MTDLNSLKEMNSVKLDEQPMTLRTAGDVSVVIAEKYSQPSSLSLATFTTSRELN
jgi:hypothetical protein